MKYSMLAITGVLVVASCSTRERLMREQGSYPSPGRTYSAEITASPQGGFLQLFVQIGDGEPIHNADDVTGCMWVDENSLVFSASPVYGKPGIFEVWCDAVEARPQGVVLRAAKNITPAYPDGTDYFELRGIKGDSIEFYYGADVDSVEFSEFRSEKNVSRVVLPVHGK